MNPSTSIPSIPIRPSSLPKLAECARYESEEFAGPAAERGTAMDSAFRAILTGSHVAWASDTNGEDIAAVEWAVATARLLAGNAPIQADEKDLRVDPGLGITPGTADCACPEKRWSGDLKSGQIRNYDEQMAAYALGFMEREFCESWTTHLFFCDEKQVITREWTHESAWDVVNPVVVTVKDPATAPTPCEYCSWCAKKWTCQTRLEPLSMLLTGAPDKLDLSRIKADPADLARLLDITHEISRDDGLHDELRSSALGYLTAQTPVPGWSLQNGRKSESIPATMLGENFGSKNPLRDAGSAKTLAACGNITGAKFRELWALAYGPGEKVPEGIIKENHGSAFVAKSRKKKASAPSA